jgi:hypothetical protein
VRFLQVVAARELGLVLEDVRVVVREKINREGLLFGALAGVS